MSESTSVLNIKLLSTGDLSALTRGKEQSEALKVSLEGLKSAMEVVGVGFSLGALVEGTKAMIEYGSAINDLSLQAGISVQAFQSLAYVSESAGIKQDELGAALNVLQKNMAEAAAGATKQNQAIADLGLNTAELLAMPVEQQIEAIGKAYIEASDKGKAWADVIALLGKNSARLKEVLQELGEKGFKKIEEENPLVMSAEAIANLDRAGDAWARIGREIETVLANSFAEGTDALRLGSAGIMSDQFKAAGIDPIQSDNKTETPKEDAAKIATQHEATIQADRNMITVHRELAKALADEANAYELPAQAAQRLRTEANAALEESHQLANSYDIEGRVKSVKLQVDAAKLRAEANQVEARAAKEKAQYDAEDADIYAKLTQLGTRQGPIQEQIAQAKGRELELSKQLDGLNENSITFRADEKKLLEQILAIKTEISGLEEKDATARVEQMVKIQDMQNKREAIAIASIEHDANLTDTQRWDEKHAILQRTVAEQERYIANMQKIANDPNAPQSARDKAGNAAGTGANALAGSREQISGMGPNPHSFIQNLNTDLTKLKNTWGTLQQNMAHGLSGTINTAFSSLSNNLSKVILGAESLGQAFRNIAVDIGTTLVQSFVDMGLKWVAQKIFMAVTGKAIDAGSTAALIPIAAAQSAIWAAPATLATIASFGGAALAAPMEIFASMGFTKAMSAMAGFESGGFTGGSDGMAAGIVHGNEFVWSAPAVRAIGVGNLERAHQAALSGGGGVSSAGSASGASGNIIIAMSPEDIARAQRGYTDARVYRTFGKMPRARYAR